MKKLSQVGLLMLVSEVLIAAFAFRWLQSEFNSEKKELQKNLFDQFISAKSRVMDSVISKKYIEPILHDPKGFKIQTVNVRGPLPPNNLTGSHFEIFNEDSSIFIDSVNSVPDPHAANIEIRVEADSMHDVLYRGVKMFITRVQGEDSATNIFEKHIFPGDTSMLKTFFTQNLKQNNLPVKTVWLDPSKNSFPPVFYYESDFLKRPFGVVIEQYNGFLLRAILPQILFAFLLLLITSIAFIFSFRSLRNQFRLATIKDDFISNMSHELKTPVATVKVAIEALLGMSEQVQKEKMNNYLHIASQELNRLDMLVNKVMSSVLMENGNENFHFETVDLKKLIDQTLKSLELPLQQRNAKVNFQVESNDITLAADPIHVQGILFNLIDNSLKYGTDEPEILIRLSLTSAEVILEFNDNGPGIPDEYLNKIFEKFFRVPSGHQHNVKGYGLGLNYVAQVMTHHHGTVTVRNLAEGGCVFTLKFPRRYET